MQTWDEFGQDSPVVGSHSVPRLVLEPHTYAVPGSPGVATGLQTLKLSAFLQVFRHIRAYM